LAIRSAQNTNNKRGEKRKQSANLCIITGKVAKYKDPNTGYCYYNAESYKLLKAKFSLKQLKK